jgi:Tfp pilus assembly protein PilF
MSSLLPLPVAASLLLLGAPAVHGQLNNASAIRGSVKDAKGQPIVGVQVELEFKGESRTKIVKKTVTDKKGGYIYSGLLPGAWVFHFSKDGYRATQLRTELSLGGISDIPPITLEPAGVDKVTEGIDDAANRPARDAPTAGPGPTSPGASANRLKELGDKYTKAMAAIKAGSNPEAETLLKELIAEVPAFAPAHEALAYVYATRGDDSAAEAEYRKGVELDPQAATSHIALSNFLATLKRNEEALKVLQDVAPQFGQDAALQYALASAAFNLGRNDEAQTAFERTAELDATNAEPHFYLGSIAVSRGDVPIAVQHLEQYVALAGANAPNLGVAKSLLDTLRKKK